MEFETDESQKSRFWKHLWAVATHTWWGVFWFLVLLLVVVGGWFWTQLPSLQGVREGLSYTVYFPTSKKDELRTEQRHLKRTDPQFIRSSTLPRYVVGAILVSEDAGFYQHQGIDWFEIKEALEKNRRTGRIVRGASTITQQVVKNAFLSREKTLLRKAVEALTALRLETVLGKEEILDYYINLIELGPGIYGIRQGSYHYFGKSPAQLGPDEAALLAFLIPSPVAYGKALKAGQPSAYRQRRMRGILRNMVFQKYLDPGRLDPDLLQELGLTQMGEWVHPDRAAEENEPLEPPIEETEEKEAEEVEAPSEGETEAAQDEDTEEDTSVNNSFGL